MANIIRSLSDRIFNKRDYILKAIIRKQLRQKNYIKAVLLALYLMPVRKTFRLNNEDIFFLTPLDNRDIFFRAPIEYYRELHKLLHISKVDGFDLIRIGRDYDGGYIMLNDFQDGGIAYSFGIFDDVSWDKAMASRGYNIFMYDHTIEKLPEENPRFHWSQIGIADGILQDERLKTLEYLIAQNHHEHEKNMILKMDVEGAEWGFLENVSSEMLSQFSQLLFEFHGVNDAGTYKRVLEVLRKINKTHQLIHLHGQNIGQYTSVGNKTFCNQIEVSYALREKYKFIDDYDVNLPLSIDMPARKNIPEAVLGMWNRDINPDDKISSITRIFF